MTSRNRQRPTVRQVAARAGVSAATVSNVMNGTGRVGPATRASVLAAARELGYAPWTSERAGKRGGTGVIGLTLTVYGDAAVDYLAIAYYRDLVVAAVAEAMRRGYLLVVMPSSMTSWGWLSTPVDGVIHVEPRIADPVRAILQRRGIPMVSAGMPTDASPDDCWVDVDVEAALALALDHLRAAGARRPALLLAEHDDAYPAQLRAGCNRWTAATGIPVQVHPFRPLPGYEENERAAALALLGSADPPDAVIGVYDGSGRHVLEAAALLGLAVPGQVRVVCFSEDHRYATTDPPVTTLSQRPDELGWRSVELLLAELDGVRGLSRHQLVAPTLTPRRSSVATTPTADSVGAQRLTVRPTPE